MRKQTWPLFRRQSALGGLEVEARVETLDELRDRVARSITQPNSRLHRPSILTPNYALEQRYASAVGEAMHKHTEPEDLLTELQIEVSKRIGDYALYDEAFADAVTTAYAAMPDSEQLAYHVRAHWAADIGIFVNPIEARKRSVAITTGKLVSVQTLYTEHGIYNSMPIPEQADFADFSELESGMRLTA